jgi:hypothetical protein
MSRRRQGAAALAAACVIVFGAASWGCRSEPPIEWKMSKQLPGDFPSDVPIYPKAELDTVVSGKGSVIFWHTSDPLSAVQAYYTKELNARGWHVTTYPGLSAAWFGDDGVTVIGTVWGRQVSFAIGQKGDQTAITAVVKG